MKGMTTVLIMALLLGSASFAAAECAWVLWSTVCVVNEACREATMVYGFDDVSNRICSVDCSCELQRRIQRVLFSPIPP